MLIMLFKIYFKNSKINLSQVTYMFLRVSGNKIIYFLVYKTENSFLVFFNICVERL